MDLLSWLPGAATRLQAFLALSLATGIGGEDEEVARKERVAQYTQLLRPIPESVLKVCVVSGGGS